MLTVIKSHLMIPVMEEILNTLKILIDGTNITSVVLKVLKVLTRQDEMIVSGLQLLCQLPAELQPDWSNEQHT